MQHSDTREYWDRRFSAVDAEYFSGLKEIVAMNPPILDLIHHFPVFTGAVNIGRFLALYEAFKQVEGIAGHYADVGTWTGASYMYIAKLMKLFEPNTPYQVHAFDWFKGMKPDSTTERQNYQGDYDRLVHLLKVQHLDDVAVGLLDQFVVEADGAELVDDHRGGGQLRLADQVIEQRRLARAEEAGDYGNGQAVGGRGAEGH